MKTHPLLMAIHVQPSQPVPHAGLLRAGKDSMQRVPCGSPAFHQLYGLSLQMVSNFRPGLGSHLGGSSPPRYPLRAAKTHAGMCRTSSNKNKGEN